MTEKNFKEYLSHVFKEFEFENIAISAYNSDFKRLRNAHDSIHEFAYLAPNLINTDEQFNTRSAFFIYHSEVFEKAHTSFLTTLMGHYNGGNMLLRNVLELIIKGAFWECLAHKKYRENADIIKQKSGKKFKNNKVTILAILKKAIAEDLSIEARLEDHSVSILDAISSFEDKEKKDIYPTLKVMIEQLTEWNILDPIQNPIEYIYDFYKILSKDVHVDLDKIDIGRRILSGKELFETEVITDNLNAYCETLQKIMDIGIVVELNILQDYIIEDKNIKNWLKKRLVNITMLKLNYSSTKIVGMLK